MIITLLLGFFFLNSLFDIIEISKSYNVPTIIDPKGEEFNPESHESVESVEVNSTDEDGKVVEVLQKGYKLYEKIIRPAKVKVGKYKK